MNVPLKCLPSEAFSAQNAVNIVWQPGSARTRWGSLQRSPDLLAEFEGYTSKERGKHEREGRGQKGWEIGERVGKGNMRHWP